jgi:hypothetical protein
VSGAAPIDYDAKERWLVSLADELRAQRGALPTSQQKAAVARLRQAKRALNVLQTALECLGVADVGRIEDALGAIRHLLNAETSRLGD